MSHASQFDQNSYEIKKYYPKDVQRINALSIQGSQGRQLCEEKQRVWEQYVRLTEVPAKRLLVTAALIRFAIDLGLAVSLGIIFSNAVLGGDLIAIYIFIPVSIILVVILLDWYQARRYMLAYDSHEKDSQPASKAPSLVPSTNRPAPSQERELGSVHSGSRAPTQRSPMPPEHLGATDTASTRAEATPNGMVGQTEDHPRPQNPDDARPPEENDRASTPRRLGSGPNSSVEPTTGLSNTEPTAKRVSDSPSTANPTKTTPPVSFHEVDIESQPIERMRSTSKGSKSELPQRHDS